MFFQCIKLHNQIKLEKRFRVPQFLNQEVKITLSTRKGTLSFKASGQTVGFLKLNYITDLHFIECFEEHFT